MNISTQAFFEALYPENFDGAYLEIRKLPSKHQTFAVTIEEAVRAAQDAAQGVYFGVGLRRDRVGTEKAVIRIPALWADVDWKDYEGDPHLAAAVVQAFELQPSIIVRSGGGYHLYWLLKEPEEVTPETRPKLRGYLLGVSKAIGGDEACRDLSRVLRVPGTMNLKDPRNPKPVVVTKWEPDRRFNLSDFAPYFVEDAPASGNGKAQVVPPVGETIPDGERNRTLLSLGGTMRRRGMSEGAIFSGLMEENRAKCEPPLPESEVREIARSAARYEPAKNEKRSSSPYTHDDDEDCPVTFNPMPLSRLLSESPDVEHLVQDIIPVATAGVLGSEAGLAKTWMLGDLAVSVATGTPWLGKFETRQGPVLVIDEENALRLLKRRALKLLRGRGLSETAEGLPIEYLVGAGLNLSNPRHVGGLDALLKDRRPALVLIDSLVRVHRGSENSATEMAAVFAEVKRLMDNYGCSFFFAHHARKLGMYNDAGSLLRGTGEIKAFVDTYLFLRKVGGVLRVEHDKSRYGEPVPNFIIEVADLPDVPEATVVRYVGEAQPDAQDRQQEAEAFILDALAEGRLSRKETLKRAKDAKFSEATIDRAIKALEETDQVERSKEGREVFFALKKQSSSSSTLIGDEDRRKGSEGIEDAVFEEVKL